MNETTAPAPIEAPDVAAPTAAAPAPEGAAAPEGMAAAAAPSPEVNPDAAEPDGMAAAPEAAKEDNQGDEVLGSPEAGYTNDGLNLPDGFSLDEGAAQGLADVCKDLNLSQKAYSTIVERMSPILEQRQAEQRDALGAKFLAAAKADPDIGQGHWKETLSDANRAFGMLDKETQQLFTTLHLNKHPGIIRAFRNIGRALGPDVVVKGRPAAAPDDPAKNFFYNSNMN